MDNNNSQQTKDSSILNETSDKMPVATNHINVLTDRYIEAIESKSKKSTPIHVDEIVSRVAKIYELVRKVIDWKEDTVLRRSAIERILKRLIFTKISGLSFTHGINAGNVAEVVTIDLIRGGHLPNDEVPREKIPQLTVGIDKYLKILERTKFSETDPLIIKTKINFYTNILEIAACELEEILSEPAKENNIIMTMAAVMNERIHIIPENAVSPEEKYTQIYIAVCRTLYDLDDAFITYQLLKYQYTQWHSPDEQFQKYLEQNIQVILSHIDTVINHPLTKDFNNICERYDTVFMLIDDLFEEYKNQPQTIKTIFLNKDELLTKFGLYYDKRYQTLKKRLLRYGIFSTLSVFLSNGFTFFLVEIPLAEIFYEGFNLFTTLIDFIVPSTVMFLLVSFIRPPPSKNKDLVLNTMLDFVYEDRKVEYIEIYAHKKKHPILMSIVGFFYITLTIITFYFVAWIFYIAKLPITSIIFDTLTIAVTIFAAVLVRNKSKELTVDDKTHSWDFILDMISVPVAKIGSFLANKWKQYNIFTIFFNFVIETPFALFLDLIESWSQFLKERRSELH